MTDYERGFDAARVRASLALQAAMSETRWRWPWQRIAGRWTTLHEASIIVERALRARQ